MADNDTLQPDDQFEGPSYTPEEVASGLPYRDTALERVKTVGEGLLKGALGPVGTATAIGFGSNPEQMRARERAHPIASSIAQGTGFATSYALSGGIAPVVGAAGEALGGGALGLGAELGLLSAGDEISKKMEQDPDQSLGSAASNIGLSTLIGLGGGAALGAAGKVIEGLGGSKAVQAATRGIEDFKAQINFRANNPNITESLAKELQEYYDKIASVPDGVYGVQGLKAQDIAKAVPEMSDKIVQQVSDLHSNISDLIAKAEAEPGIYGGQRLQALKEYHARLGNALQAGGDSSAQVFDALNTFKKDIGPLKNWNALNPTTEKPISKLAGDIYGKVQEALEDSDVWGNAGKRQQAINQAFSDYLPKLKDFERAFMQNVAGEKVVDPGKVTTFLNQLGKDTADIRQAKLRNFIDSSEKFGSVVDRSHANLGLEAPDWRSPLPIAKALLQDMTPGAKLADAMVNRGLAKAGGRIVGGAIGGGLGSLLGHGALGAIVGQHALGPMAESVLPALIKPILEKATSVEGLRGAVDYGMAVAKGENMLSQAAKNVLKATGPAIPEHLYPTEKAIERLHNGVGAAQSNPALLLQSGRKVAHYLPNHGATIAASAQQAVQVLASLKPNTSPVGPLEDDRKPNRIEDAKYTKALKLAEQPAISLDKIKDGSLTQGDMALLSQIHPGFVDNVRQKLIQAVADHVSKGEIVPFKVRSGLSMFLGQPLDVALQPVNILANQMIAPPGGVAQQGQAQATGKGTSKTGQQKSALQKLSGMYNTPVQAREKEKTNVS